MSLYQIPLKDIDGNELELHKYQGQVMLIVNTASKCGFTPQYKDLEKLYEEYKDQGFVILGAPCNQFADQEPGTNEEVKSFCAINYGVSFPILEKMEVRGSGAHPLFSHLTKALKFNGFNTENPSEKMLSLFLHDKFPTYLLGDGVKWNFTKFLVDRSGKPVKRFESPIDPLDLRQDIEALL